MIPVRLELKNFMSYGEDVPPIEFAQMQMVCLSGENGHGKSALLDAITWALWGESRAGKNKHDELVRIGADEMSVQFTFEMDSQTYRVLRKRSRRASGNQWELQQSTGGETWRSLSGNTSGETEKAIQKLLRMSYDTFVNSAYLRQGQADQFVKQSPGKRKEILGEILDLSRYDQLEAKARDKARIAAGEATDLQRDINLIEAELSNEPSYKEHLARLQEQFAGLQERERVLRAEWDTLKERKTLADSRRQLREAAQKQIIALTKEIQGLNVEIAEYQAEALNWKALYDRRDEICRDFAELEALRITVTDLEEKVQKLHRGRNMLANAENELLKARTDIERQVASAKTEHEGALRRMEDYPDVQASYDRLAPQVERGAALEAERQSLLEKLTVLRETMFKLQTESGGLKSEVEQWERRIQALDSQEGVCTVCNSPLPPNKVASTRASYEAELAQCLTRRKEVWDDAKRIKSEVTASEQRVGVLERELNGIVDARVKLGQLSQHLLQLDAVRAELPNLEKIRTDITQVLIAGQFAPDVSSKIETYKVALAKLANVEEDYDKARTRLAKLAYVERDQLQLQHAESALKSAEERRLRASENLALRQESLADYNAQIASLIDAGNELAVIDARLAEIKVLETARQQEQHKATQEIGRYDQHLTHCETLKVQRTEKQRLFTETEKQREIHDQLTKAFGKKGVQALIIENAIPELQEEANRLLERLTDGDMSVYFETLREAKSKKDTPIETLDIKVSDSLGTRALEMYSGGEGFRAAFALRIALSKLLARRAGAKLQTLIIDEGFGTQDGKGREKLVDALNAIRQDFEKIIVITHIDELKDAFPMRIEVVKTALGSQVTIMEGASG